MRSANARQTKVSLWPVSSSCSLLYGPLSAPICLLVLVVDVNMGIHTCGTIMILLLSSSSVASKHYRSLFAGNNKSEGMANEPAVRYSIDEVSGEGHFRWRDNLAHDSETGPSMVMIIVREASDFLCRRVAVSRADVTSGTDAQADF